MFILPVCVTLGLPLGPIESFSSPLSKEIGISSAFSQVDAPFPEEGGQTAGNSSV